MDNGLDFNKEIKELIRRYDITHQKTVSFIPKQNGSAEEENRAVYLARIAKKLSIKM